LMVSEMAYHDSTMEKEFRLGYTETRLESILVDYDFPASSPFC